MVIDSCYIVVTVIWHGIPIHMCINYLSTSYLSPSISWSIIALHCDIILLCMCIDLPCHLYHLQLAEYGRMTKDVNRSAYTRKIMEIVSNIKKQKEEIDKVYLKLLLLSNFNQHKIVVSQLYFKRIFANKLLVWMLL